MSISPTCYEQLLRQNPLAKKLQTQIVSTKSCAKNFQTKKAAHKILVKWTQEWIPQSSIINRENIQSKFLGPQELLK